MSTRRPRSRKRSRYRARRMGTQYGGKRLSGRLVQRATILVGGRVARIRVGEVLRARGRVGQLVHLQRVQHVTMRDRPEEASACERYPLGKPIQTLRDQGEQLPRLGVVDQLSHKRVSARVRQR